jgi:hypothetical protein
VVPLHLLYSAATLEHMGRYQSLVGKKVEAHYRAGDLQLSATGTLASDSGKSIFLEDRFTQAGKEKTLRVEIPYQYLITIEESSGTPDAGGSLSPPTRTSSKHPLRSKRR